MAITTKTRQRIVQLLDEEDSAEDGAEDGESSEEG